MADRNGINALARVIADRARLEGTHAPRDAVIELGTIQRDLSLIADSFPINIPRGDYLVCKSITERLQGLQAGDRVLVAWLGKNVVIIDTVS